MNPAEQHLPQSQHHLHRCATIATSTVPPNPDSYDELDPKDRIQVRSLIPKKEQALYSGALKKINKRLIPQNRILIITDKALYNIQPKEDFFANLAFSISPSSAIKRKIDIKKVFAITLSVKGTEQHGQFVIHVNDEYDYRYDAGAKCERIIKSILKSYFMYFKVPFILYLREEADLASFHTTDDDLRASVDKRPKEGKIFVTPEIMAKGLAWIVANRKALLQQTNMFYSIPSLNNLSTSQESFSQQASMNIGPQVQTQSLKQDQGMNSNVQANDYNNVVRIPPVRAQSVGREPQSVAREPQINYDMISVQPQYNNAQLNFSGANNNQNEPVVPVVKKTESNVNTYQTPKPVDDVPVPQFDFLPSNLVSTSTNYNNYNVQISTNFEEKYYA